MDPERRRRINRIKKFILGFVFLAILIPVTICIISAVRIGRLKKEISSLNEREKALQAQLVKAASASSMNSSTAKEKPEKTAAVPAKNKLINPFDSSSLATQEVLPETEPYYIYLTFDDGPSVMTDDILRILRRYDVKATFFCVGTNDEDLLSEYRKILDGGHTLGMHSYSHRYKEIYASEDSFLEDLNAIRSLIITQTGQMPIYYRFPGGSSNEIASRSQMQTYIGALHSQGVEYIDWNVSGEDASGKNPSADEITESVFKDFGKYHTNVVLLHDAASHKETVEALPKIIERARDMGAVLLPVTEDTVPVQHLK